ncbi:MAG TPA: FAD-dependent oxidoreductase [Solirubrobacteraceae bacterium]|nr:FAD-dependent oxidoreductase [Solirubrobacteraceae bacterium]
MTETTTPRVVIAGGGVAALETLIALRDLAGDRVDITLVAPADAFTERPMTVAEPFGEGHARRYELAEIAKNFGARLVRDSVVGVDPETHRVDCQSGEELTYDHLVLAVGAKARPAYTHAITFGQDPSEDALHGLLADIESGYADHVAFVVPSGTAWTLPLYEIALMTARQAWSMSIGRVRFTLVTPEERPLALFGPTASEAIGELLEAHGIEFIGSTYPSVEHGHVLLDPGGRQLDGARVVSLPVLDGPDLPGVPADPSGFIPVDTHGRVPGLDGVYAAGDGTTFPIKQGGLATQQADAVAEVIAAAVGARVVPEPFRPVLRGRLLTGGDDRYLRHGVGGGQGEGDAEAQALWWPPAKIAGRYLAPYLYGRDEHLRVERIETGYVPVDVTLDLVAGAGRR